jgi:hypothetical protein
LFGCDLFFEFIAYLELLSFYISFDMSHCPTRPHYATHHTKKDLTELKCHAVDDGAPRLPKDPEYTARVLETAQYEWNTTNGCKKYAFDRMAFAKRCLRAKAGVT